MTPVAWRIALRAWFLCGVVSEFLFGIGLGFVRSAKRRP